MNTTYERSEHDWLGLLQDYPQNSGCLKGVLWALLAMWDHGVGVTTPVEVLLVGVPWLAPGLPPWVPNIVLVLDMMEI